MGGKERRPGPHHRQAELDMVGRGGQTRCKVGGNYRCTLGRAAALLGSELAVSLSIHPTGHHPTYPFSPFPVPGTPLRPPPAQPGDKCANITYRKGSGHGAGASP